MRIQNWVAGVIVAAIVAVMGGCNSNGTPQRWAHQLGDQSYNMDLATKSPSLGGTGKPSIVNHPGDIAWE